MALNFSDYKCEICGATCTRVLFATFLCDSEDCLQTACDNRGGPGGHMKRKAEGRPIVPEDVCNEKE